MKIKKVKDLKQGEYFTLKPIDCPKERQVYIRGEYDRESKTYCCERFDNINYWRFFKSDREVYVDFIF